MIKFIWVLIGINTTALCVFIAAYFILNSGKNVSYEEKGWTVILAGLGLLIILLAAIPLRFSSSSGTQIFSGIFAALPLVITLIIVISNNLPSFEKHQTLAEFYYKDKTQRSIATAIEQNDTSLLKELIKGQDLNIRGKMEVDGLRYLQFAVRLQGDNKTSNKEANTAAIRLLLNNGAKATPALSEAVMRLPIDIVSLLLEHGADPNTYGYANNDPLLFETIRTEKEKIDIGILLIQKGADVNAKAENNYNLTPAMYAANNARTSALWNEAWLFVRYLLEKANADYLYTNSDGNNLQRIIRKTREDAAKEKVIMTPDFDKVVEWLKQHKVDTEPANTQSPETITNEK